MGVRVRWALLAIALWSLWECQAATPQSTVADIQDQLFSPTSQQYSIYILPEGQQSESVQKRQANYQESLEVLDVDDPLPEPEHSKKADDYEIKRGSRFIYNNQDTVRGPRNIQHASTNNFRSIPGASSQVFQHNSGKVNYGHNNSPRSNIEILSFQPEGQKPNFQYEPDMAFEVPPMKNIPYYITSFDPKLQPGYGHEEELVDKMDSYTYLEEPTQYPTQGSEPPTELATTQMTFATDDDLYEPTAEPEPTPTEVYDQVTGKPRTEKKLLDTPKKVMKVIKAAPDGEYIPQEVPGVMVKTVSGEEAFVPADLLEDTEKFLASASAQQPTFSRTSPPVPGPVPMRGMPFQFGYIVDDEATANYQTRQEKGDSNGVVTGCYQVLDPNGLVRTVIYRADENGFRILSLSRGPDKTPCPGLDDATRSPIRTPAPTPRPQQPRPTFTNVGGFNQNANQGFNQNAASQFSSSSSSSSSSQSSQSSQSNQSSQFNAFSGKNGLFEQPSVSKQTTASDQYNLQGSAREAWMAEYLQNITKNLYSSFTNSSTFTNTNTYGSEGKSGNGLVNFPFVLIPITTFLDLQNSGAIGKDVQSYGAFIQPEQRQSQASQYLQQQQQQRQQQQRQQQQQQNQQKKFTETTQHTVFNTFNTTKSETQQKAHKSQGVNTVNYQINGIRQQGGQAAKQVAQQQRYQNQQSSQSSKSSSSSSNSSSTSNFQSNFAGNQGHSSASQSNQGWPTPSSYGSKPKPGVPGVRYGPPPRPSPPRPTVPKPTPQRPTVPKPFPQRPTVPRPTPQRPIVPRPTPQRPIVPRPTPQRPTLPRPTPQRPNQYRPNQPQPTQNFIQQSGNNRGSASFSSQKSQSSQQSESSQEKQSSASNFQFGNGLASQNFQSSSSKSSKAAKNAQSSSSSQSSFSGAGGNAGSQRSSSSKSSSSSASSSSSSSSSQQSFNGFSGVGANAGFNFHQPQFPQRRSALPEPRASPSFLSTTYVASSPSSVPQTSTIPRANTIPKLTNIKSNFQPSHQEQLYPGLLEEPSTSGSLGYEVAEPTYNLDDDNNGSEGTFQPPAPEPEDSNMNGWIPMKETFSPHSNFQTTNNQETVHVPQTRPSPSFSSTTQVAPQPHQNNAGGNQAAGNTFHYSSSSQNSENKSNSQQSQQQFSSSWSNRGSGNPQQFFSKANQQVAAAGPSQKHPRQLPQHESYQIQGWGNRQQFGR